MAVMRNVEIRVIKFDLELMNTSFFEEVNSIKFTKNVLINVANLSDRQRSGIPSTYEGQNEYYTECEGACALTAVTKKAHAHKPTHTPA